MTAHDIANGLMARPRRNGKGWLVLCPVHGDNHPSLSVRDGEDGKLLVKCFSGCDSREILRTLRDMRLLGGSPLRPVEPPKPEKPVNRADLLNRLWEEAHPIEPGGLVACYMKCRGIELSDWPSDIREHPNFAVYEDGKRTGQRFPAVLVVIRNVEGCPSGLHITFINEDGSGKAGIDSPRRIIGAKEGSTRGGCVRLMEPKDGTIGLAEGIETALSAYLLTGTPCWAALTAGGIERAELTEDIRRVVIFADRDKAGLKAAANACERFRNEGRESEILAPDNWKSDFNDILRTNKNAQSVAS